MPNFLLRKEAAKYARVGSAAINRAIKSHELRHIQIGRRILIAEIDLSEWLQRNAYGPLDEAA
jgi:excisionase family DNA binding protein